MIYYVDLDRKRLSFLDRLLGAVDIEDGLSWETAFRSLHKVIEIFKPKEDSIRCVKLSE